MKTRFTAQATDDLNQIADYLRERNPRAALRVRDAILEALQILGSFPRAGRAQTTLGVRKLVTRKYAYLIYYAINEVADELIVLSVKHPSQEREHEDS